jgi:hypothetical protein
MPSRAVPCRQSYRGTPACRNALDHSWPVLHPALGVRLRYPVIVNPGSNLINSATVSRASRSCPSCHCAIAMALSVEV